MGVISNGVDSWTSARASRNLPGTIEINPDLPGYGDEGTTLLEIVHDIAPEAALAFSSYGSSLRMVQAILWLANDAFEGEGADIIVDDLGFYSEPFFEDGLVALAAADSVAGGVVFVSAAGYQAREHYEGNYVDGGDGYHAFDGASDTTLRLDIEVVRLTLQWNDEFGASGNDYDLFVCRPGLRPTKFNLRNDQCEGSTRAQDGDGSPYESVFALFDGEPEADVYIHKYSGAARRLELFAIGSGYIKEHRVSEGGIVGHPVVDGVIAAGAVRAADPGHDDLESFSDWGPAEIYFPTRETRKKPDVVGIDGVSVTGAGGFPSTFFGTPAAAPHVAGVAALALEAQRLARPDMTKKEVADAVTDLLRTSAVDIGEQESDGYNKEFGYGRADAFAAVDSPGQVPATFTVDSTGDGADSDTADGDCDGGSGDCTLRAAIQEANAGDGGVIQFNIPGSGTRTIQPASALPTAAKSLFIDGYSQPGAGPGSILIELDGTNAGAGADGLKLRGKNSYVRGLAINRFNGNGIVLESSGGQIVEGNRIGTNIAGSTDLGNGAAGVYVNGAAGVVIISNVISGNDSHGGSISGNAASGTLIYDNIIGVNAAGSADLGNSSSGVYVLGAPRTEIVKNLISGNDTHGVSITGSATRYSQISENFIGASESGQSLPNTESGVHIDGGANTNVIQDNTIAHNTGDGLTVESAGATDNSIQGNSIHSNSGLGIDLSADGVTSNDTGDKDTGPNDLQNFPILTAVAVRADAAAAVFNLDVTAGIRYVVEFYANDSCDGSGNGEGKELLGFSYVVSPSSGRVNTRSSTIDRSISSYRFPTGTHITATATVLDSTSEFSSFIERVVLPELESSEEKVEVTEGNTTTYNVALSQLPSSDVTVKLSSEDEEVATVSPSTMTFTTTNGTTAQSVTVTGVSDDDPLAGVTAIFHTVVIGGNDFAAGLVPVEVADDDAPELTLTHDPALEGIIYDGLLRLDEGGTDTYTVTLREEPPDDVTVTLYSTVRGQ